MILPAVLWLVLTTGLLLILETAVHTHQESYNSKWFGEEVKIATLKIIRAKRQFLNIQVEHLMDLISRSDQISPTAFLSFFYLFLWCISLSY